MFLLVSNFKMIGMLLNIVHGEVQKKLTKIYNKGFPNHSTLMNYEFVHHSDLMWCPTRLCSSFLIYINDLHNSSAKFLFYLFADDTNLLYADKNLKSLEKTVNSELVKVSDRLNENKLTLNVKKSNFVMFRKLPT